MRPLALFLRRSALAAALWLAPAAAHAGEAMDLVKTRQSSAIKLIKTEPKPSAAREARVSALLLSFFDFAALSRATLSEEEWKKHPEEEHKEFTSLLSRLIQRSLERSLAQVSDFTVEYLTEEENAGTFTVKTRASRRSEEPVEISYALRKGESGLKAIDVSMDGNSTVKNYQKQFSRVLAKEGWPALLAKMRKKLEKSED